mmetsp:Transcript_25545/g.33397  ORF Transcript_25545/g.33397 Transcript_25545/m.33397 type:complete len:310 (+) Transcript_25545:197-1126(+)
MLSFDEFHAIRERQRKEKKEIESGQISSLHEGLRKRDTRKTTKNYTTEISDNNDATSAKNKFKSRNRDSIETKEERLSVVGSFLELPELQLVLICLIYLDIFCSVGELLLTKESPKTESAQKLAIRVGNILQSVTGFTVCVFCFEILALLGSFRMRFLTHIGYMLDLVLLALFLYAEISGVTKAIRLLGFLRGWRVLRLASLSAKRAQEEAQTAQAVVEEQRLQLQEAQAEQIRLSTALKRESESRRRVEQMLQGYKDEVETLNEALKIAALDIAAAAESEMEGESEELEEEIEQTVYIAPDGTFAKRS